MIFNGLVPILYCQSVEDCFSFYADALRFIEIRRRDGHAGLEWIYLKSDHTYLMLEQRNQVDTATDSCNLYFFTDDIEAQYTFSKARGYKISQPEKTEYGLMECHIQDPEGRLLRIGQRSS